ncbi:hypothetical protein Poli38472_004225 [Pythium oligandrum]|uniref:Transmembrane protein n=1 Tax=Pythium oligandrum TaxID=41045 RepID=A0A8K1CN96_PYTOL|nr:hypothetical protein Poli38472_004225 [Pythium oligandrum]|eukprot:TMW66460.1 hypothetical protein Poli38472_004225 [Pythium oligandrum]
MVESGAYSFRTLFGVVKHDDNFGEYHAEYIAHYVGTKSIKESPLFTEVFKNDSTPRQDTVYLQSMDEVSHVSCEGIRTYNDWLYGNEFMRSHWQDIVTQTSYNLTYLQDTELIAPVVDCSFSAITLGDITRARVFYLMRAKTDPSRVFIIVMSISTQDYKIPELYEVGPCVFVKLTVIEDMQATTLPRSLALAMGYPFDGPFYSAYTFQEVTADGFAVLEHVPKDPKVEYRHRVHTASRSGFYCKSEESQSNIKNMNWKVFNDPVLAMTTWQWEGSTVIQNSWGWVRCVYFALAIDSFFNLCVLITVIYHNFQRHKVWVGDAFVSISNTLQLRGAMVLIVWAMENFWQVYVHTLRYGTAQGNLVRFFSFPQVMHGDLMALYVSLAGLLGTLLHERIDPALTIFLFEVGFRNRLMIGELILSLKVIAVRCAITDYLSGIADAPSALKGFSPLRFWTTHRFEQNLSASFAAILPNFMTFAIIIVYAAIRKAYRRVYPSAAISHSSHLTKGSSIISEGVGAKCPFTMFEMATGAELQNRVGLVADYDSCVYIKGMRFATADGIYCNGFVIVDSRWLIRTSDILSVLLIIVTGKRLRDVYVYEVKDHTASQTAKLVYPNTMTLKNLTKLNTTLLS